MDFRPIHLRRRNDGTLRFFRPIYYSIVLYEFLYITLDRERTRRRSISFDHIAFSVDEELGKVPLDTPIPEPSFLQFEELIQWVSTRPIHIDLRE